MIMKNSGKTSDSSDIFPFIPPHFPRKGNSFRNILALFIISGSFLLWFSQINLHANPDNREQTAYQPDPDPVQGLNSFMERHGVKPYDLFQRGDELMTLRVIFRDQKYGTPVWMLDTSPVADHGGTASVWSAWNKNASTIFVEGPRESGGTIHSGWFFNSDFSRMRPAQGGRPAVWDPVNPDLYYDPINPADRIVRNNWRTGEQQIVAQWDDPLIWNGSTKRLYGLTRDRRYLFVDLPNRGIFVPFAHDENYPIPLLPLYDGRPLGPGGQSVGSNHFTVIYDHEEHGNMIALRTGMLIDRQTGVRTNIVAPLCGNTNYLRTFHEGRIQYPKGKEWDSYGLPWFNENVRLPVDLSMDELYDTWFNLPHVTHGHESPSPDWQFIATDGGTTRIVRVRDGEVRSLRLSPDGGNYHLQWIHHPRFFVGWVRGWNFRSFTRPQNANIEFQIFSDGTFQPIVDTKHRPSGYYAGGDFSMFSPDATKIHYGSSMTGRFRNYIAVMARPRPPVNLSWRATGAAVELSWTPSKYNNETKGYLVYRSNTSGYGYDLLTPEPVKGTSWEDRSIIAGQPYYYAVTSLEHSDLESGYSNEASRAGIQLKGEVNDPLIIYVEGEEAIRNLTTDALPGLAKGRDVNGASDWYYLYRHPEADHGRLPLQLNIPAEGLYNIWTRVRNDKTQQGRWLLNFEGTALEASAATDLWTWINAGQVHLTSGDIEIILSTGDEGAALDIICLTTDGHFRPQGTRPENRQPPASPAGLMVENVLERTNHLKWEKSSDPRLSHYNVYASGKPFSRPMQEQLIGSPTYTELIDWGLKDDTRYYYAVTAVDRQGNESDPVFMEAKPPPRDFPETRIELAFAEAKTTGRFERSEAEGLRGEAYLVPAEPGSNRVEWEVDIPRDGKYFFWLRYLHRGTGNRGGEVSQDIPVLLGGKPLTILAPGLTDLNIPDELLEKGHPLAEDLWTWAWPGPIPTVNPVPVELPAGRHTIVLKGLHESVRYDVLILSDEPGYRPDDGRLRQRY